MSHTPKSVLITGAAKRIGRFVALELAAHGWRVALHYNTSAADAADALAAVSAWPGDHAAFQADLYDEAATRALVPAVLQQFGRLDAVVNSASLFELDDAANFSYQMLETHMRINTGAPIILAQALHSHLLDRQAQGCVVNLLDQKLWNVNPDFLSYSLSKSALQLATTMLAQSFAPTLRVCAVAPGLTLPSHLQNEQDFARTGRLSLLGKTSSPEDVAKSTRFLLETDSITGAALLVDAGQHLTASARDVSFL